MSTFLSILPIIIALVLYFTGIPIAYALFAAALTYFGFIDTTTVPYLLMQKFITSTQSFPFLAIPFFIMCGSIMNYGGISARLMDFADALTGHLPGGLAQINVLLSMLMGGCSGSANADAAMECKLLVPEMEKRGYGKGFSRRDHGGVLVRHAHHPARDQPHRLRSDRRCIRRSALCCRLHPRPAHGCDADDRRGDHLQKARLRAVPPAPCDARRDRPAGAQVLLGAVFPAGHHHGHALRHLHADGSRRCGRALLPDRGQVRLQGSAQGALHPHPARDHLRHRHRHAHHRVGDRVRLLPQLGEHPDHAAQRRDELCQQQVPRAAGHEHRAAHRRHVPRGRRGRSSSSLRSWCRS